MSKNIKSWVAPQRKAAFVNLSSGQVEVRMIPDRIRELYLGGRGLGSYLLYNLVEPGIDPLGPENVLIISTGILTATPIPCPSRIHIGGKSPLTGLVGSSNMGGFFGPELRFAGFDALIIQGKASKPVYLWIHNGEIEIRDASHLWGRNPYETQTAIREELGDPEIRSMTIGVAGENLVKFSVALTGVKNAAGRTGMGALMGSKNLKAVAVRGSMPIEIADPEGALEFLKELADSSLKTKYAEILGRFGTLFLFDSLNSSGLLRTRNFQANQLPNSEEVECEGIEEYSSGMTACYGCFLHCRHKYVLKEGLGKGEYAEGPEFASVAAFSAELGNNRMQPALEATHLANKLGLDTIESGSMISWAIELQEKGLLPKELTRDLKLEWGNMDSVLTLVQDIAYRRGLGDVLAEGPKGAIKRLGPKTAHYNIQVKGMSCNVSDERAAPSLALGIATATRGADHLRSRCALDLYGLPVPVLEMIYGRKGMTSDYRDYQGKPWMVFSTENSKVVIDSLGICQYAGSGLSPNMAKGPEFSRMLEYITGIKLNDKELLEVGERVTTIERLFNIREGMSRKDDYLPERYYREPTPLGMPATRGRFIDRAKYEVMLDEYYEFHGWDSNGNPTPETLRRLSLDKEPSHLQGSESWPKS
ncbi:MAG: aldehyde ferredoxin oxidoreductase family protein [Deltaproteobacteria bacterium]|nr:aldehyde ferredoxin oxidoreductase family protein [Deltaproteobacteria bacterium]